MTTAVERAAELLGVEIIAQAHATTVDDVPNAEPVPEPYPQPVAEALESDPPTTADGRVDRSKALYRLMAASKESGLRVGQALWLAKQYPPAVEKRPDPVELARDVARCWERLGTGLWLGAEPVPRVQAHRTFRRWLGEDFDLDAVDALLATLASHLLPGDPLWLLIVSGSGNAKTELVNAAAGAGAHVTSKISSEGALLSATPKRETVSGSTGGLLRKIGSTGVLGIKDVTSILETDRNVRGSMLAALREVYDGMWERNVGTDGGVSLTWWGRITVIGGVTTAWDRAREVVAAMGDRFVLIRLDSALGRMSAGRQSIDNTGYENQMRAELRAVVGGVLATVRPGQMITLTEAESDRLLAAADVATLARTGVEFDYRGDVVDAHAPEMPTRFAKQLTQLMRGAVAVGMSRESALRLAIRCAADSLPPLRLAVLRAVTDKPGVLATEVARALNKPRATVVRQMDALHTLGLVTTTEDKGSRFYPHPAVHVSVLASPEM